MSKFSDIKDFLAFRSKAGNAHSLHSPFVFELYNEVALPKNRLVKKLQKVREIENQRWDLIKDNTVLNYKDLGAGSKTLDQERTISKIARTSLKSQKQAIFLMRLARYLKPKNILELGTSLGITTAYLRLASDEVKVTSIEGVEAIHKKAEQVLSSLKMEDVELINDNFDNCLESILAKGDVDFFYVDGNHTYEATTRYFDAFRKVANNDSCVVLDDIYWSEGMKKAWQEIVERDDVTLSLDFYNLGVVFFRDKQPKQHFQLKM